MTRKRITLLFCSILLVLSILIFSGCNNGVANSKSSSVIESIVSSSDVKSHLSSSISLDDNASLKENDTPNIFKEITEKNQTIDGVEFVFSHIPKGDIEQLIASYMICGATNQNKDARNYELYYDNNGFTENINPIYSNYYIGSISEVEKDELKNEKSDTFSTVSLENERLFSLSGQTDGSKTYTEFVDYYKLNDAHLIKVNHSFTLLPEARSAGQQAADEHPYQYTSYFILAKNTNSVYKIACSRYYA